MARMLSSLSRASSCRSSMPNPGANRTSAAPPSAARKTVSTRKESRRSAARQNPALLGLMNAPSGHGQQSVGIGAVLGMERAADARRRIPLLEDGPDGPAFLGQVA